VLVEAEVEGHHGLPAVAADHGQAVALRALLQLPARLRHHRHQVGRHHALVGGEAPGAQLVVPAHGEQRQADIAEHGQPGGERLVAAVGRAAREEVREVQTLSSTELGWARVCTEVRPRIRPSFTQVSWPAVLPSTNTASASCVRCEQAKLGRMVELGQAMVCCCSLPPLTPASASTEASPPSSPSSSRAGWAKVSLCTLPTVGPPWAPALPPAPRTRAP